MTRLSPCGVITLTTDVGHKGPFAAVMKGVIASRCPSARIIDLAQDIPVAWPPEAGFWISHSYRYFPTGSVHVAVVDPGSGAARDIVAAIHDEHLFIAPDNGLLDPVVRHATDAQVFHVDVARLVELDVKDPSPTFPGRDIFAPLAAEIAAGNVSIADVAERINEWTPGWVGEARLSNGIVSGVVVSVDAFGNLITNVEASLVTDFQRPIAHIAGHNIGVQRSYGNAVPGDYLALLNSFGVIEIARAEGSAADGLGVERGAPIAVSNRSG